MQLQVLREVISGDIAHSILHQIHPTVLAWWYFNSARKKDIQLKDALFFFPFTLYSIEEANQLLMLQVIVQSTCLLQSPFTLQFLRIVSLH